MRITVAMRVIGGFVVISLLLIALGISSIFSMRSIGGASEELSTVALPTVAGSLDLKASFFNLGRLTFEGFVSDTYDEASEKRAAYQNVKNTFDESMNKLKNVTKRDPQLNETVDKVQGIYSKFTISTANMFDSHLIAIDHETSLGSTFEQLEEKVDDASSLLLDFNDLDDIADSSSLQAASELTENMESGLLSLLATLAEYRKTETLARAELRSKDLNVLLEQSKDRLNEILSVANNEDNSGTLDEVAVLIGEVDVLISSPE